MWRFLLFILFMLLRLSNGSGATQRDNKNIAIPLYDGTSFDYDYAIGANNEDDQLSETARQNAFMRYWNHLMRNVRIPIPTITWNMTRPFANFFRHRQSNVIEEPVSNQFEYQNEINDNRRRKSSRKTKNSHKSSKKQRNKRRRTQYDDNVQDDEEQTQQQEEQVQKPAVLLQTYPNNIGLHNAIYFYDPYRDQYYQAQHMRKQDNYNYINSVEQFEEAPEQIQDEEDTVNNDSGEVLNAESEHASTVNGYESVEQLNINDQDSNTQASSQEDNTTAASDENKEQEIRLAPIKIKQHKKQRLRNAIGSYMRDDGPNNKRQRNNPRISNKNFVKSKSKPRNAFNYLIMQRW